MLCRNIIGIASKTGETAYIYSDFKVYGDGTT